MSSTVLELMDELLFFADDIYLLYIEKVFLILSSCLLTFLALSLVFAVSLSQSVA